MSVLKTHILHNFIFIIISFIAFNQTPTFVRAQEYEYSPLDFTAPLKTSRGNITPIAEGDTYLTDADACHLFTTEWGWEKENCTYVDKFIIPVNPKIDSITFDKPNSEGFVKFDDWDNGNRDEEIEQIWKDLIVSLEAQSKKLNTSIKAERWHMYPTLDKENNLMYYSTLINWDGIPTINIDVTKFDRKGYVNFKVIPTGIISPEEAEELIRQISPMYATQTGNKYSEFVTGDKVAAVGVVGVLAALVGVKYSKGFFAGLLAFLLIIAKKAWFLLLLPFIYLKKFFTKKNDDS